MPVFLYEGKSLDGSKVKGMIDLETKDEVKEMLRVKGIFPTSIRENNKGATLEFNIKKGIPFEYLAILCRQFYFALSAGIPMLRSIAMIKDQIEHKKLKRILENVYEEVQKGSSLSEVFHKHKDIPFMLTSMVEVGEVTGNIDMVMEEMADYYDKQHRQKKKIDAALTYPKFLLIFSLCIVIGLVSFVVPTFVDSILSAGQELPVPTQIIILISEFVNGNFVLIVLILIGLFAVKKLFIDTNYIIQYRIDKFLIVDRHLGKITQQIFTARFARTFGMLVKGGMSIIEALTIAANAVDNKFIKKQVDEATKLISAGAGIGDTLEAKNIFPLMLTQMIRVGEDTGSLDSILKKTSEYYEIEAEFAIHKLTSLIEPTMIVLLAFIVGFVVVSIAMPMFQVMGAV
ncbi:type II secretion system F family protein [Clostridium sp. D53t1_180928_C8]|uniref:type II secretion system F family protein n=1 Tax=Clostridium sp. D53t1_180928_C8 TaxID=2787101 RepID=UPI0018A95F2D|nr:type II secretion system F family protein [Clostridium sp. D53t1_180928_C8]